MVARMTREMFVQEIERFLEKSGMSARKFSVEAAGDSAFIYRLRAGKNVTIAKIEQVQAYIQQRKGSNKKKKEIKGDSG